MKKKQIILLIPTRNRRSDLTRLFGSFLKQTIKPDGIMIIDGSDPDKRVEDFKDKYPDLNVSYVPVFPPGLTKQRNVGLDHVDDKYDFVGFLDDDLELYPDAVEKMMAFWDSAEDHMAGASFNIVNNEPSPASFMHRFFLISNKKGGTILPSGNNVILHPVEKDTKVQWLSGGATVWRAEIFKRYRYEERYGGYGSMDDLDFCLSLPKNYEMIVLKEAKVLHHLHEVRSDKMKQFGEYDAVNRFRFVQRFNFSRLAFSWATTGRILAYSVKGIVKRDKPSMDFAKGYLSGVFQIFKGKKSYAAHDIK